MLTGIYANAERDIGLSFTKKLTDLLLREGMDVAVHESARGSVRGVPVFGNDCDPKPDVIVSLGGDGTILSAMAFAAPAGVPVLGVNLGGMGFLTTMTAEGDAAREVVKMLSSGEWSVSERAMLSVEAGGKTYHALNEVVFYKCSLGKTVDVSVKVGDSHVAKYKADGFIVSTPTGSTGWALSAGGPIIAPDVPCLLLLPMNCHQLSARPVIAGNGEPVTVTGGEEGSVITDGIVASDNTRSMTVRLSKYTAKLVTHCGFDFYGRLTQKLGLAK